MLSEKLVEGKIYDTRKKKICEKKVQKGIVIIKLLLLKSSHKVLESHTVSFL